MGPPGCGKSSAAWVELTLCAKDAPQNVFIWIDLTESSASILYNGLISSEVLVNSATTTVDDFIVDKFYPSIVVLDGMRQAYLTVWDKLCKELTRHVKKGTVTKLQIITSMQTSIPPYIERCVPAYHMAKAWSMDDYLAAIENANFFNLVADNLGAIPGEDYTTLESRIDLLKRKCDFSGSSARWTFDYKIDKVISEVERYVLKVVDYPEFLALNIGEASNQAINHLFYTRNDLKRDFTSSLVPRIVAFNCNDSDFFKQATLIAKKHLNPSFDGHILEIDFLNAIQFQTLVTVICGETAAAAKLITYRRIQDIEYDEHKNGLFKFDTNYCSYQTNTVIRFERDVLDHPLSRDELCSGVVMIPLAFNQGGFDAAQFVSSLTEVPKLKFRFYQVTRAGSHDIKVHYMRVFRDKIKADLEKAGVNFYEIFDEIMEVVVVAPRETARGYLHPERWNIIGDTRDPNRQIERRVAAFTRADEL